ncbi:hypothetical protein [Streptomyces clavuligerus]|uniref:Membrane protein YndG n=1 Tax=Streptomyces clavuligerus TaxID=1901 RepID=E2Q0G3_STRCL|nr:hypothetical protein [Streptomyces clavuligerus]ANW16968.1 hypothetical protein BB341_01340 [Streptomyces clavuligerus]AXU11497.1 hypothetical protein D1794_01415 [Streptomyces clavuligerus]EFG10506.1 Hypothetical protein SCLAV_5439 [Streptomyces clavuligerus]MBY6301316.1 hypothetical protein [Streptomyces clavuligerus]QCS04369.1 hypothetical protein CRV15_01415 [Streptomyces clavuligerus]
MGLYVETFIRAELEEVWALSQRPERHRRWDLRFTDITALPTAPGDPQRFRYATRVLPFVQVSGTGVSAGEKHRPDGTRTSALRFRSTHPLSLLAEGSGYWRYVPARAGVRFLTGYDYAPRWGRFGRIADRAVFRPLMGWATAWSFDRLRLWLERGVTPERAFVHAAAETVLRVACVAGAAAVSPVAALAAAVPAVLVPPSPLTPAARRCRRAPATAVRAPRVLHTLPLVEEPR